MTWAWSHDRMSLSPGRSRPSKHKFVIKKCCRNFFYFLKWRKFDEIHETWNFYFFLKICRESWKFDELHAHLKNIYSFKIGRENFWSEKISGLDFSRRHIHYKERKTKQMRRKVLEKLWAKISNNEYELQ